MEGKKLSKRDKETIQFISQYKDMGYLPHALFNFLTLLGWSPKENKEIFTKEELIKIFDPTRFNHSPSKFDVEKLNWFNNFYIKELPDNEYIKNMKKYVKNEIFEQLPENKKP